MATPSVMLPSETEISIPPETLVASADKLVARAIGRFGGSASLTDLLSFFAESPQTHTPRGPGEKAPALGRRRDDVSLSLAFRAATTSLLHATDETAFVCALLESRLVRDDLKSLRTQSFAHIGGELVAMTSLRFDRVAGERRLTHTHWQQIRPLLGEATRHFALATAAQDTSSVLGSLAATTFYLAQARPLVSGTASLIACVLGYALALRGHQVPVFTCDPALIACVFPTVADFTPSFFDSISLKSLQAPPRYAPEPHILGRAAAAGFARDGLAQALLSTSIDVRGPGGLTALQQAALHGQAKSLRELLEQGAQVDGTTPGTEETALLLAIGIGCTEAVKVLLRANAETRLADWLGQSPLHLAASLGHEAIALLLLGAKATVQTTDGRGLTPLARASRRGHTRLVAMFLNATDKDASPDLAALGLATENGHATIIRMLGAHPWVAKRGPRERSLTRQAPMRALRPQDRESVAEMTRLGVWAPGVALFLQKRPAMSEAVFLAWAELLTAPLPRRERVKVAERLRALVA